MKIAHIALWTRQLEQQARFWTSFFNGQINEKYCSRTNPGFESYFVKIGEDIAIELMCKPGLQAVTPLHSVPAALPSWLWSWRPQAQTAPSAVSARLCW